MAKRDLIRDNYERATQRLYSDKAAFADFLEFSGRFYKMPSSQVIMLYDDNPKAAMVADYDTWKKFGRRIKPGGWSTDVLSDDSIKRLYDISMTRGEKVPYQWTLDRKTAEEYTKRLSKAENREFAGMTACIDHLALKAVDERFDDITSSLGVSENDETNFRKSFTSMVRRVIAARCEWNSDYTNHGKSLSLYALNMLQSSDEMETLIEQVQITAKDVLRSMEKTINNIIFERSMGNDERDERIDRARGEDTGRGSAPSVVRGGENVSSVDNDAQREDVQTRREDVSVQPDDGAVSDERGAGTDGEPDKSLGQRVAEIYDGELPVGYSSTSRAIPMGADSAQNRPRGVGDSGESTGGISSGKSASNVGERDSVGGTVENADRGTDNRVFGERSEDDAVNPKTNNNTSAEELSPAVKLLSVKIADLSDKFVQKYDGEYAELTLARYAFANAGAEYDLNKSVSENITDMLINGNSAYLESYLKAISNEAYEGRIIIDEGITAGELLSELAKLNEPEQLTIHGEAPKNISDELDLSDIPPDTDKFYVNRDNESVRWSRYDPDKAQLIYNYFTFDDLFEAVIQDDPLEYLDTFSRKEMFNADSADFPEKAREFLADNEDFNSEDENFGEKLTALIEPRYAIYQLKSEESTRDYRFASFDELKNNGLYVDRENYNRVYRARMKDGETLEDVFTKFNVDRPEDFHGHSLSTSDIIAIKLHGKAFAQYVDSAGFKEIPDFFLSREERKARRTLTDNLTLLADNQLASDEMDTLGDKLFRYDEALKYKGSSNYWLIGAGMTADKFEDITTRYHNGEDVRAELAKGMYGKLNHIEFFERSSDGIGDIEISAVKDENGITFRTKGGFEITHSWETLGDALIIAARQEFDRHDELDRRYREQEEKAKAAEAPYVTVKPFSKVDFAKIGLDSEKHYTIPEFNEALANADKLYTADDNNSLRVDTFTVTLHIGEKNYQYRPMLGAEYGTLSAIMDDSSLVNSSNISITTQEKELVAEIEGTAQVRAFKEKTAENFSSINGFNSADIENVVRDYVQDLLESNDIDAKIVDLAVSGSRSRNLESDNSDLDIAIEFNSDLKEDALFNILHEEPFEIGGVTVDINPIRKEETGMLGTYLENAEKTIFENHERKAAENSRENSVTAYRVGDFYEFFAEDAQTTSDLLNLTIVKRQDVPMTGVPFHAFEDYKAKLAAQGYDVKIGDNLELEKLLNLKREERVNPRFESIFLDEAKERINEYTQREFGENADYTDLSHVPLAYTTHEETDAEISVYANLSEKTIVTMYGGEIAEKELFDSNEEMLGALGNLDFDELVAVDEDVVKRLSNAKEKNIPQTNELTENYDNDTPELEWKPVLESIDESTGKPSIWSTEINSEIYGRYLWITKNEHDTYDVEYDTGRSGYGSIMPISSESAGLRSLSDAMDWAQDWAEENGILQVEKISESKGINRGETGEEKLAKFGYKLLDPAARKEAMVYYNSEEWFITDANDRNKILEPKEYGADSNEELLSDIAENNPDYADFINSHISELSKAIDNATNFVSRETADVERDRLIADMFVGGGYGEDTADARAEARIEELDGIIKKLDGATLAEERLEESTEKIKAAHEREAQFDAAFEKLFNETELDDKQKRFLERAKKTMEINNFDRLGDVFTSPAIRIAFGSPENVYKLFEGEEKFREIEEKLNAETTETTYYNEKKLITATKVDDFYEFYGEVAEELSEKFDLTLTNRDGKPMVGVPQHTFDDFCSNLYDKGYIVENWQHYQEDIKPHVGEFSDVPNLSEQLSLFDNDEQMTDFTRETVKSTIEFLPSENPKTVDALRVGDYVRYDGNIWKITDIDGDFSISFENTDKSSIQSVSSIIGHWKEHLTKDGFKHFVPKIVVDQALDTNNEIENSDEIEYIKSVAYSLKEEDIVTGGAKAKFAANIAAIKTLRQIEDERRTATPNEQNTLARYVGWGGIPQAFDSDNAEWASEYTQLKELLTPDEYEAARSTVLTAHYTSPTIISAIYSALENFGFKGGNVLEPSMGIGNFFGVMPEEMRSQSHLHGVELDDISGRIAKQLYPNADIQICGYENTTFSDNFFDAAIGNVPFGNYPVADTRYDREHFLIHDYFFAKTLDKVAPGGVVAFITSKGTLDKTSPKVREYLAKRADLIGAIRLPNNAFKANAGTEVTSDIIFLQKREKMSVEKPDWCYTAQIAEGISVNQYFIDHPEMILGEMRLVSGRYGEETACVPIKGADLKEQLSNAVTRLKRDIMTVRHEQRRGEEHGIIPATADVRNFTFTELDDKIYFRENNIMREIPFSKRNHERMRGMIGIRNTFRELVDAQSDGCSDETLSGLQFKLNAEYDAFVMNFGHISDIENRKLFAVDDDYNTLCGGLELINPETKEVTKADVFTKRTIKPYAEVTHVNTPQEALFVSLDMRGSVDIDYMSGLCETPREDVIKELADDGFIYKNPETEGYEEAAEYLSGYVREKLRTAQKAAEKNPEYERNVAALEKALPPKLSAGDISVRLGAPWVSIEDYCNFFNEYAQGSIRQGSIYSRATVLYRSVSGEYKIENKNADRSVASQSSFGTKRMNSYAIFENLLNNRDIAVYDTFDLPDGKKKRVMNKDETQLAQEKARQMKEAFPKWLWADPERREKYVNIYNELFNSLVGREYDGSHQTFPGMNPFIELNKHQKNAVMRAKIGGNTLLAHCVGAGKTFEMAAAVMEKRRLGLINKACIVVPKHLVGQMSAEWLRLYPEARLLTAKENDFNEANRQKFIGRCCTGDYDAVIMSYQQFQKIPMSVEYQQEFLVEQLNDLTAQLSEFGDKHLFADDKRSIKDLERMKKNIEAKLKKLLDTPRDNSLSFEQLGFDCVVADEAHNYKNGLVVTKMKNVSGIGSKAAKKSEDFLMKTRYLNDKYGERNLILATGTPVSNSMTELYIMQQYLRPSALRRQGLQNFDDWASTFGEVVSQLELKPAGDGFRMKKRFAKFTNLPELMQTYKDFADIRTAEMLNLPVPEVEGGKPQIISAKPNEYQQAYMKVLAERSEAIHNGSVDPSVDNMLKITNEARLLGLDARCLNPDADNYPNSKVNLLISKVMEIYTETTEQRGVQAIFCDIAINAGKKDPNEIEIEEQPDGSEKTLSAEEQAELLGASKFSVYDYIKDELIRRGIPENEICFAGDAKDQGQRGELYAQLRAGTKRIVLASTTKMGTGANVQTRLCALHNLDIPWKPSDFEQRIGRIVRQGNRFSSVKIFNYVTEGTFDAYMLNLIVTKQKFISQLMSGKTPARTCEDVDELVLNYSEMQAIASGDPRIKEKIQLDTDVSRLRLLESEHLNSKYRLEDTIKLCETRISIDKKSIALAHGDKEYAVKKQLPEGVFRITINGKVFTERKEAGAELQKAQMAFLSEKRSTDIGEYCGFKMSLNWGLVSMSQYGVSVSLTRPEGLAYSAELGLQNDLGNISRIENVLKLGIDKMILALESDKARHEKDLAEAKRTKYAPFEYADELAEKSRRLAQLDAELGVGKSDEVVIDDGETPNEERDGRDNDPPAQNIKPKRPRR